MGPKLSLPATKTGNGGAQQQQKKPTDVVIGLALDTFTLFHDEADRALAEDDSGEPLPLESSEFRQWLEYHYSESAGTAPSKHAVNVAINMLTAKAIHEGKPRKAQELPWRFGLHLDREGRVEGTLYEGTLYNVVLIMTHDPAWMGLLSFNELGRLVTAAARPPWDSGSGAWEKRTWLERDDVKAVVWFAQHYGMKVVKSVVGTAIGAIAIENPFQPVRVYLNSLEWDSKPRLSQFFQRYFGAADTEWSRAIGPLWMVSAVARVFKPGDQVDTVLILEGDEGRGWGPVTEEDPTPGKTSAFRALAVKPEWHVGRLPGMTGKDAVITIRKAWIVEDAEMISVKGSVNAKAFLTTPIDNIRDPYAVRNEANPRMGIIVATTNERYYLKPGEKHRRYWPVCCGRIDVAALKRNIDQLWAEAVHLYRSGAKWHLHTRKLEELHDAEIASRLIPDKSLRIEEYIAENVPVVNGVKTVRLRETIGELWGKAHDKNPKYTQLVADTLRKLGFQHQQSGHYKVNEWVRHETTEPTLPPSKPTKPGEQHTKRRK
jgi:predicted P-loop ATPase